MEGDLRILIRAQIDPAYNYCLLRTIQFCVFCEIYKIGLSLNMLPSFPLFALQFSEACSLSICFNAILLCSLLVSLGLYLSLQLSSLPNLKMSACAVS